MRQYSNTVTDASDNAVENAQVTVYDQNGDKATLYSDDGVTTTTNPLYTDSNGAFSFYVADGTYDIEVVKASTGSKTLDNVYIGSSTSAFAITLLDDTSAGSFLTTLGVSSYIQTLIDDTSAGGARTTLDAVSTTDLASTASVSLGDALIGVKHTGSGAVARTQHDKNLDFVSVADFDTLANAKTAAGDKLLFEEDIGKLWVLGGKTPSFDEASNVLARQIAFDNQGNDVTVSAGNQYNFIGIRNAGAANDFVIGDGSKVSGYEYYLRSLATSHSGSDCYGVIGVTYNAGPGTVKSIYGRSIAESGSTGIVMGGILAAETRSGVSNSTALQMTCDSADGTALTNFIWGTKNSAGTLSCGTGILFDSAVSFTDTAIKVFAVGAGNFLNLKNSTGSANLFVVNSSGAISECKGLTVNGASNFNSDLAISSQTVAAFSNTTRTYQLQAVTSGDYFRIIVGSVGDGFKLDSSLDVTLYGNLTAPKAITSTGATHGVGYATGAGGTVTQATDKSTGVELNKVCGEVVMNNATLNSATAVSFTLTNSAIAANDVVVACIKSAATAAAYTVQVDAIAAGSCRISVRNQSAGNLGEAIVIGFAVIKAVVA